MSERIRIAIDIHDVLADYVGEMTRRIGWPVAYSGRLTQFWPTHDWKHHWADQTEFLASLQPIAHAADVLNTWRLSGRFDCFYLTATRERYRQLVEEWLERHGFPAFRLVMTENIDGKIEWIKQNEEPIDYLIEDMPEILVVAQDYVRKPVIYDTPWNRSYNGRGMRMRNWTSIGTWID